jgi:hypothetical protein
MVAAYYSAQVMASNGGAPAAAGASGGPGAAVGSARGHRRQWQTHGSGRLRYMQPDTNDGPTPTEIIIRKLDELEKQVGQRELVQALSNTWTRWPGSARSRA